MLGTGMNSGTGALLALAYYGGGGGETAYEPDPPKCPDWAARFFQNMGIYSKMAEQAKVNVNFIMALSALESHWDDTHAQDLGNLFGLTHGGHNNIDFRNNKTLSEQAGYQASADYWTSHYGSKVAGATDLATFWSDLQPKKGKYNTKNSDYFSTLSDVYDSVLQRREDCNK